jgi:hypothetical protein
VTAPAQPTARPPMRDWESGALADDVAAACGRHCVPAWSEDDRDRLEEALWRFTHPDLAGTPADPWASPDEQETPS